MTIYFDSLLASRKLTFVGLPTTRTVVPYLTRALSRFKNQSKKKTLSNNISYKISEVR